MMPDLGKYAVEVTLAYAGSLILLLALVGTSVIQSRRAKKLLQDTEGRQTDG